MRCDQRRTIPTRVGRTYCVRCRVFSRRMIQVHPGEIERVARAVEARWTWPDPPVVTQTPVFREKRGPASGGLKRHRNSG